MVILVVQVFLVVVIIVIKLTSADLTGSSTFNFCEAAGDSILKRGGPLICERHGFQHPKP